MIMDNMVPEIRFKEFSGEWVENNLGELIDIRSAARVHKKQWTDTGVPFFRTSDVVSIYKGEENTKAYISHEIYQELSEKIGRVTRDDLLITGGGSIGIPYLVPNDNPLYFKDADLLWLKNNKKCNGYFLYTFFFSETFKKHIKSISHTGTIAHYTIEQAKATPINTCNDEEQTQIGNYFQKLDTFINQHQQKHNKLSNIKKAMLEKMFAKQDETIPEIRFKGFSGEWKMKELSEIGSFSSGVGFSESEQSGKSGIPFFKVSDMNLMGNDCYMTSANNYVNEEQILRLNYTPIRENSILFAKVGAAIFLERKRIAKDFLIDNNMMAFSPTQDIIFMKQWFDSISLSKHTQVGALPSLKASDLGKIKIRIPKREEQIKIGNYFQKLDALINQHQQQITKLNNIKQACLSKMFV
ncbi:restriction endonuclease subunit S [Klebsiella aerogenes]|uniref:restriction endonuclease subunit S n=1 Tax=Klebsiella aerogenes TaxID=548 RepID=UPI00063CA3DF|nr:restriction endonuclease subunit S [Klebsiella aerogenes]KLF10681.1 restriction endonuclease subunit S [Klebsiella aerogenes]